MIASYSLRILAQDRYFAELMAREQRRSLNSFINWCIREQIKKFPTELFDDSEMERIKKLYKYDASLLTFEERKKLKEKK